MKLTELFTWKGELDGGTYCRAGLFLTALKFLIDYLVSTFGFGRAWSPVFYLVPSRGLQELSSGGQDYYLVMALVSLPFLWIGSVLTLRRLRTMDWLPLGFVVFFVVPVLNLGMFVLLSVDTTGRQRGPRGRRPQRAGVSRWVPVGAVPAALVALAVWCALAAPLLLVAAGALEFYGWSLFFLLPFGLGFITGVILGYHRRRSLPTTMFVTLLCLAATGTLLFLIGLEGAVCLGIAAPLLVPTALLGGLLGNAAMSGSPEQQRGGRRLTPVLVLLIPGAMGIESEAAPDPALREVSTEVVIAAPRSEVWRHVVSFAELPEPEEWWFHIGIAYPMRAEITGSGVGAVRHCVFSTGSFVEPIEVWEEPELLRFSVTENPPTMREWSPWPDLEPAHLEGSFRAERGQFRLQALPDGSTRLVGTTWYRQELWPAFYWHLWSDEIVHRIHTRVLRHIKRLCEG